MLVHLLVVCVVLGIIVYFAQTLLVPQVPPPVRWLIYLLIFVLCLAVLLPFLGVNLGAL
jgi:hypothetical protein